MQQLKELLESAVSLTTFDMGRMEFQADGIRSSYAKRPEEVIESYKFHEIVNGNTWNDEFIAAQSARLIVHEEAYSQLNSFLHVLLDEYIDAETDKIGHLFPVYGRSSYGSHSSDGNWLRSSVYVSQVGDIACALVRGAAVLGTERVFNLVSGWVQGKPVEYRSSTLIRELYIDEDLVPLDGVHISSLPRSSDTLPGNLPRIDSLLKADYLGRTVASLDTCAMPAFLHPDILHEDNGVRVASASGFGFPHIYKALSLVENNHIEPGIFWNDYLELSSLCLSYRANIWSFPDSSHSRPLPSGTLRRFDDVTDAETIILPEGSISNIDREELRDALKAVAGLNSRELNLAIERWSKSKRSKSNLEDSFIDLRIALEALYLKDFTNEYSQEMRFRLALFGAWHLGDDLEKRQTIRKTIRDAYDGASGVVHGRDLEYNESNRKLLADAQDLCRQGILRLIEEGIPSPEEWGDLILGSALPRH